MSKDKGSKNTKKAPADKSSGKKVLSAYKAGDKGNQPTLEAFVPKTDAKGSKSSKKPPASFF